MFKQLYRYLIILLLGLAWTPLASAIDLTGAGASFPYPIYAKWAAKYYAQTGHRVNFQSIGSGGGQQQIIARTVDFGASDDPMKQADLDKYGLVQFPTVIGAIVPIINIDGIKPGELSLTGKLLADIFLGKIVKWNDAAIRELNPDVPLPDREIVVVHRSDGSGTTFHWTDYLSQVSADWQNQVGRGKAVKWPAGHGGKGNEGVAAYVSQLEDTIGYVEYAFASQNGLSWIKLQNRDGNFIQPGPESFNAAVSNASLDNSESSGIKLINLPGANSWPITAATYVLVPRDPPRPRFVQAVLDFFDWAWQDGSELAVQIHFVPLPDNITSKVHDVWAEQIKLPQSNKQ